MSGFKLVNDRKVRFFACPQRSPEMGMYVITRVCEDEAVPMTNDLFPSPVSAVVAAASFGGSVKAVSLG